MFICMKMHIFIQINMPFYTKKSASGVSISLTYFTGLGVEAISVFLEFTCCKYYSFYTGDPDLKTWHPMHFLTLQYLSNCDIGYLIYPILGTFTFLVLVA